MKSFTKHKTAVIIGAGPAGLTAAYELLKRTDIIPIVVEESCHMGGIARTINHNGNRMDIGGHRFFSKNQSIMNWWLLPSTKYSPAQPQLIQEDPTPKLPNA